MRIAAPRKFIFAPPPRALPRFAKKAKPPDPAPVTPPPPPPAPPQTTAQKKRAMLFSAVQNHFESALIAVLGAQKGFFELLEMAVARDPGLKTFHPRLIAFNSIRLLNAHVRPDGNFVILPTGRAIREYIDLIQKSSLGITLPEALVAASIQIAEPSEEEQRLADQLVEVQHDFDARLKTHYKTTDPFSKLHPRARKDFDFFAKNDTEFYGFISCRNLNEHHNQAGEYLMIPSAWAVARYRALVEEMFVPASLLLTYAHDAVEYAHDTSIDTVRANLSAKRPFIVFRRPTGRLAIVTSGMLMEWWGKAGTVHRREITAATAEEIYHQYRERDVTESMCVGMGITVEKARKEFDKNRRLVAMIITDDGTSTGKLVKIATPHAFALT